MSTTNAKYSGYRDLERIESIWRNGNVLSNINLCAATLIDAAFWLKDVSIEEICIWCDLHNIEFLHDKKFMEEIAFNAGGIDLPTYISQLDEDLPKQMLRNLLHLEHFSKAIATQVDSCYGERTEQIPDCR